MRKVAWIALGLICAPLAMGSAPAAAARRDLAQCMAIDEPAARLTCYDAALGRREPPRGTGAPPRMPPPGSSVAVAPPPSPALAPRLAAPRAAPGASTIEGRIVAVARAGNDLFRFQLSDGSIWRTGEQGPVPRAGETVRIRRSVLAYYAAIGGRASIGVRPVR